MMPDTASLKRELRAQMRARMRNMTTAERAAASAPACGLLALQRAWREAKTVLFYAPLADEIDLRPLAEAGLAAGKIIALPRFDAASGNYSACLIEDFARDCAPGQFGVLEPVAGLAPIPLKQLDLALVPGVCFDTAGRRLGRGKAFYDRMLAQVAGTTCGVAFDEQLIEHVPVEPHDIILNCILTPTRWVETPGQRPVLL